MFELLENYKDLLNKDLFNKVIVDGAVIVGILFAFWILRKLFARYIFKILLGFSKKTKTDMDTKLLLSFEKPLQIFFVILGIYLSFRYLPLTEYQEALAVHFFRTSIIILTAWGFYNFTGTCSGLFNKIQEKLDIQMDKILIPFLSKILRFLILFIAGVLIADEWGFEISTFIAGLGLGGLAFALAAKDTASNMFGGVVIILDKPFSIGDWIETPTVEGTVEDISFRSTKVRTFAHALVTVPNSTLANQPITNWTRMGKRRITFNLGVTYSTPRDKLEKVVNDIRDMLETHPEIHKQTIFVHFDKFNDSSLDIFLYFFTITTSWSEYLKVKEDVNYRIMNILEQEGVSVAFPSRSVYLESPVEKKIN
ncbi:MAG: mechanosensitive ion channel family protein [Bacillota bacterium]